MPTNALQRKMMAELLEKIKNWPEDALRSLREAIEQRLKPESDKKPSRKNGGTMDAFGAWVGPETAEEIIGWIRDGRVDTPEREPLD